MNTKKISTNKKTEDIHVLNIEKLSLREIQGRINTIGIEKIALETKHEKIFHIGALCYRKRARIGASALYESPLSSLDTKRSEAIKNLTTENITRVKTGEITSTTLISNLRQFRLFNNWAEDNNHENFLYSEENYQLAINAHWKSVKRSYLNNEIAPHTAQLKQAASLNLAYHIFPHSEFTFARPPEGIISKQFTTPTLVPTEMDMGYAIASCSEIFYGLTDALLCEKKFPFEITVQGEKVWVVPNMHFCKPKAMDGKVFLRSVWDYSTGFPTSPASPPSHTAKVIENAHFVLKSENSEILPTQKYRRLLSKWAHDCFLFIFAANTGINEEQIKNLEWEEDKYELSPETQGFRTVKWRAGNKAQHFTISASFVKAFKKYLELRKYIINGGQFNRLFIQIPTTPNKEIRFLQTSNLGKLNKSFQAILDPNHPSISYRQLRLYKQNHLIATHGIAITSSIMQCSIGTISKAYSSCEKSKAFKEISAFYNMFSNAATKFHDQIPAGHCQKPGSPSLINSIEINSEVTNCKNFVTCLFCENFVAHATVDDARKLFSLIYFLNEIKHLSSSADEFENLNGPILIRANEILDLLKATSKSFEESLKKVEESVFKNEELSEYWAALLNKIVSFGGIE